MLVNHRGKYFPIALEDIASLFTENEIVWLYRKNGEKYVVDYTLDELEKMFEAKDFYRANRQYILSRQAIQEFEPYFNRKLAVKLTQQNPELITISKVKTPDFIRWIEMG
jgi:two-component system LytT family response regulator